MDEIGLPGGSQDEIDLVRMWAAVFTNHSCYSEQWAVTPFVMRDLMARVAVELMKAKR